MACKFLSRFLVPYAFCLTGFAGLGLAASAAVHDRIVTPSTRTSYVAIPDSVHPKAKLATDMGQAPAGTRLQGMSIRFNMSGDQQAALDQLLADQQNPSSPRYHQWLTPAQYADQFGMSSADLEQVSSWLRSQGFDVTGIANGRTFITFDGTVAQAEAAFATSIHNLSFKGETHFANVMSVSVPSAFAGVVSAVTGMHNFRLQPHVRSNVVSPRFTSSLTGTHFIAPGDLYTIYDVGPLLSAGINGTGETIAVTGQVLLYPADVAAFRSASGLSASNLPTTQLSGVSPGNANNCTPSSTQSCATPNQGDLMESSIDVEWSGAMAPSATILFVAGQDIINNSMTSAIDGDLAPIVTISYGNCEAAWGTTELLTLNTLFKQGNAQGQTILAAAGDNGAADCDAGPSATDGLAVDFPGSSPYVTSMGGTTLDDGTGTGATNYWFGADATFVAGSAVPGASYSAVRYIPETVWNDTSLDLFEGTGGGASQFFTKPAWQVGLGVPADAVRDVPDISLDASNAHDSLLFCINVAQGSSCTNGFRDSASNLTTAGGTSFDSQIFGGILALVEQNIGLRLGIGNANPTIYALANSAAYYTPGHTILDNPSAVFNDVISGSNALQCTAGSPNCGNGGLTGYSATAGYDLATGWGSVNAANLANAWVWGMTHAVSGGASAPNNSVTTLSATPGAVTAGATVTLTATVSGTVGTPTGTVQFLSNNVALGSAIPLLSNGVATYSWATSCLVAGQQVITAVYSGDVNYQGSIAPVLTAGGSQTPAGLVTTTPVIVQVSTNACPDFALSTTTPTVTVPAGGSLPVVTITATKVNDFVGTVTFSTIQSTTSGYNPTVTFSPASITLNSSAAVTTTLTLSGITAGLRLPKTPGQRDSGTMLARRTTGKVPWYAAGSGVAVASLFLLILPRRRRLGGLLAVALAVALISGATGCGASSQAVVSPPTPTPPPATNPYVGTYTVTVIGTYTNSANQVTEHSTMVTYTIN